MKRFFTLLAPLIFFVSCNPAHAQTQTFWGNVNIEGSLDVIINATVSKILAANGSASTPSVTFTNDSTSGLYLVGTGEVDIAAGGVQAIDILKSGSNIHFGFNAAAQGSGDPFTAVDSLNGSSFFSYTNSSTGTSSATVLTVVNGTSGSNSTNIENHANHTSGPFAGGSAITSGTNQTQLSLAAEYSGAFMNFLVGGTNSSNEIIRLNTANMTVDNGFPIIMNGSSSGAVTIAPGAAAAGTYTFGLPTSGGTAGQPLLSNGGSGAQTYGTLGVAGGGTGDSSFTAYAPIVGGTTTTGVLQSASSGQSNVGWVLTSTGTSSVPTFQAPGTPTFSGLTSNALLYASSSTTVASLTATGTAGQTIVSSGSSAVPSWQPANTYNFLINGGFDIWQAGTSATLTATGGGTPTAAYLYQPDQWYVKNILGGGTIEGIITFSQVTGVTNGSLFGAKAQITTAPTGTGIQNGLEIYQPLSNKASAPLYGQTASFTVLVKSFGNVNQAGVQFYYATSETKLATAIGSEVTCTVNSSTFSSCTINGQALGTSQTAAGIVGVRIRPTAVSTGNLYDLNNGLVLEQAMLNLGSVAMPFVRQNPNPAQELLAAQYFYEVWLAGASTNRNIAIGYVSTANTTGIFTFPFKVSKRSNAATSVDAASHFNVSNGSTNNAATAAADAGSSADQGSINFTLTGTYSVNSGLQLLNNSTAARIFFDARM